MPSWADSVEEDAATLRRKLAAAQDRIQQLEERHERDQRSLREAWTFARAVLPTRAGRGTR